MTWWVTFSALIHRNHRHYQLSTTNSSSSVYRHSTIHKSEHEQLSTLLHTIFLNLFPFINARIAIIIMGLLEEDVSACLATSHLLRSWEAQVPKFHFLVEVSQPAVHHVIILRRNITPLFSTEKNYWKLLEKGSFKMQGKKSPQPCSIMYCTLAQKENKLRYPQGKNSRKFSPRFSKLNLQQNSSNTSIFL